METINWEIWGPVGAIIVLVLLSGFFSGSETALTAASRARLHGLEKDGNKRAALVNRLRERKEKLIGALLLGNNLVNILASALATSVLIEWVGETGVVYATLIMTLMLLIFAEVLPKTYAIINADKMAMRIAPIIAVITYIFGPFTEAIGWIVKKLLKLFGTNVDEAIVSESEEELRGAIELHDISETIHIQEKKAMLHSILDLADLEVSDIMTHRSNVEIVDAETPVTDLINQVLNNAYSRLPVYRDKQDNIIGILHSKGLLREISAHNGDMSRVDITHILSDPWFIPETTVLFDQLQAFRERKEHFAIVVDEYGGFEGIVTLEDILEEIVGDIEDEHDVSVPGVRAQPGGQYVVEGTVTIRDLNRALNWNLPDEDYATIAGLVLHESKMIPAVGQNFSFYGYRFRILKRQRNQITLIRISEDLAAQQVI